MVSLTVDASGDPVASKPLPSHYVQVAAVPSKVEANNRLAGFRAFAPLLLNSAPAVISPRESDQGTFFRIQFGPMGEVEAHQLQQMLSALEIDAFVATE